VAKRNVHGDLEGRISGKRHNHSNRCQHIEGDFPFGGWDGPNNDFGDPIKTYFDWKRIRYPEYYFNEEFGKLVNPNSDFHFREAKRLGIEPQDLAKVIVTVAHFVERASTNYPSNEAVRAKAARTDEPSVEGTVYRAVPFGEIFAVLGSNADDLKYKFLLEGTSTVVGEAGKRTGDGKYGLPDSDFKAHSRFLILALSWLVEFGVLHLHLKKHPTDSHPGDRDSVSRDEWDALLPYYKQVHWFQESIYKCDVDCDTGNYCFTPQEMYSTVAWKSLVFNMKKSIEAIGSQSSFALVFNSVSETADIEANFNYDLQPYWCPVVYRGH